MFKHLNVKKKIESRKKQYDIKKDTSVFPNTYKSNIDVQQVVNRFNQRNSNKLRSILTCDSCIFFLSSRDECGLHNVHTLSTSTACVQHDSGN